MNGATVHSLVSWNQSTSNLQKELTLLYLKRLKQRKIKSFHSAVAICNWKKKIMLDAEKNTKFFVRGPAQWWHLISISCPESFIFFKKETELEKPKSEILFVSSLVFWVVGFILSSLFTCSSVRQPITCGYSFISIGSNLSTRHLKQTKHVPISKPWTADKFQIR